ncbi:hypothetical protein [Aureivirga sp. CE67]|uniref:hypothetical protein n=1 Tax=Aureivirga sp. CE67 TaxID=1788983 RepID=UPI0018CACC2A|nr:hypothetical protein [Aureivirga sp. CE67]
MKKVNLLKGKITQDYGSGIFLVYVEEIESEIIVTASGKSRLVYWNELVIGNEIIIEINPRDKTKGRIGKRSFDFWSFDRMEKN